MLRQIDTTSKLSSEEVLRQIDTTAKIDGKIIQAVEEKLSELEDYYYFTRELQNQARDHQDE